MNKSTKHSAQRTARTRKASLTYLGSLMQQGAQLLSGFFITPIIASGLGVELYGAWIVVREISNYLALGDFRASSSLKLKLAITQSSIDDQKRKRLIGATVSVWAMLLPLMILSVAIAVIIAPIFARVSINQIEHLKLAVAIIGASSILGGLASIPHNALRGMNLDFKLAVPNSFEILLIAVLSALAVTNNLGLPGIAGASLLGMFSGGLIKLSIARNVFGWISFKMPGLNLVKEMIGISAGVLGATIGSMLLSSIAILLIGALFGAGDVAIFSMTGIALRMGQGPMNKVIESAGPGLADLWGRRKILYLCSLRSLMQDFSLMSMTILGSGVLILNRNFLELWVGNEFFSGEFLTLIFAITAASASFSIIDSILIDCMLKLRQKTIAIVTSTLMVALLVVFIGQNYGIEGIGVSFLLGRVGYSVFLNMYVTNGMRQPYFNYLKDKIRPLGAFLLLLSIAYLISLKIPPQMDWVEFGLSALTIGFLFATLFWFIGISKSHQRELIAHGLGALRSIRER